MRKCAVCGKSYIYKTKRIKTISQYNPTVKTKKKANLQWVTVPPQVTKKEFKPLMGKRVLACTQCIKTLYTKGGISILKEKEKA